MKRTHPAVLVVMAFAGMAALPGAVAQTATSPAGHGHGQGMVSAQQHATGASAMFKRMDADGDGYATAAEMEAFGSMMGAVHGRAAGMPMGAGMMMPAMMGMIDSDGDGSVSAQEHAAAAKARFERLDADRNGRITQAEWSATHHEIPGGEGMPRGPGAAGAGRPGMGAGMGMGTMGMGPWRSSADWLGRMDRDGDGRISAAEHGVGTQALFEEADTDNDGNLSAAEMAAHRALMMRRGQSAPAAKDDGGGR
jgi:Ca2+-binding EF-hand superfamily protein